MAKGLRASSKKANKNKLRSAIFSRVEAERNERLSAKLLELASTSTPTVREDKDVNMDDANQQLNSTVSETAGNPVKQVREGVEIDVLTGLSPRPRYPSVSGRIRRRKSFRKDKPITFTIKRKKEKPSQRKVKY